MPRILRLSGTSLWMSLREQTISLDGIAVFVDRIADLISG